MEREQQTASMHVVQTDGSICSRGRAAVQILGELPGLRSLPQRVDRGVLLTWIIERLYSLVSQHRHHLGQLSSETPIPPMRWRDP
jgi:predicted DCC family thiol-disulfide oxidoreductase YuxK